MFLSLENKVQKLRAVAGELVIQGPSVFKKEEKSNIVCNKYAIVYCIVDNRTIFISSPGDVQKQAWKKHGWYSWYSTTQTSLNPFFQEDKDRIESSKNRATCPINVRCESKIPAYPPSPILLTNLQLYCISPTSPSPSSNSSCLFTRCQLLYMPAVVLYYSRSYELNFF